MCADTSGDRYTVQSQLEKLQVNIFLYSSILIVIGAAVEGFYHLYWTILWFIWKDCVIYYYIIVQKLWFITFSNIFIVQEFFVIKEEGQIFLHSAITWGEKTMGNTSVEGREVIRNELNQLQIEWDHLISEVIYFYIF